MQSPGNNALSPSRADARDSLISSISRDTLSTNETHEQENFDDWFVINFILRYLYFITRYLFMYFKAITFTNSNYLRNIVNSLL